MKKIFFIINRIIFSKGPVLVLSTFGIALLFLVAQTSCNKKAVDAKDGGSTAKNSAENNGRRHINVRSKGAAADGVTDDTKAFQEAIDEVAANGGGTVWVPPGDYSINTDTSINLKSNVILSMADRARLIADTNNHERYYIIRLTSIHDAQVLGGQIIGDRDYHIGTTGEHGYGIAVSGSSNIQVRNTHISNCWGDGLVVARNSGHIPANITVKGIVSTNNRRQAISIINVNGIIIDSCLLSSTGGTKPEDGIDIEPDVTANPTSAENITITNCDIYSNGGNGIEINARGGNIIRNVTVQYNKIHGNKYSGYLQKGDSLTFTNNWLYGNKYDGNHFHNSRCTNAVFEPNTYHAP